MQENAAPLQQHPECYLCVLGAGSTSLLVTVPTEGAGHEIQVEIPTTDSEEPENGPKTDDAAPADDAQPRRVFSPSLPDGMVCRVFMFLSIP
jgi:hypothetical protein